MKKIRILCSVIALGILLSLPLWLRPYVVRGFSMHPALSSGDMVLADMLSLNFSAPKRGELIIFHNPHKKYTTGEVDIKRVIGLPGETVKVRPNSVAINDTVYEKGTVMGGVGEGNGIEFDMKLGPEDYFVLGDDRSDSSDSRLFGAVQASDLIGRAAVRMLPLSSAGILYGRVK